MTLTHRHIDKSVSHLRTQRPCDQNRPHVNINSGPWLFLSVFDWIYGVDWMLHAICVWKVTILGLVGRCPALPGSISTQMQPVNPLHHCIGYWQVSWIKRPCSEMKSQAGVAVRHVASFISMNWGFWGMYIFNVDYLFSGSKISVVFDLILGVPLLLHVVVFSLH